MYSIIETQAGETHFELFKQIPRIVYPYYKRQHQQNNQINVDYLKSCLILKKGTEVLGRAALYINPFLKKDGQKYGSIGNYECVDDLEASEALLSRATQLLQSYGVDYILGPFNGSSWDNYRFCTDNSHPNFFLEAFNPVYYNEQFLNFGFEVIAEYVSSIDRKNLRQPQPELALAEQQFRDQGVQFRSIDLERYEAELEKVYTFCLQAFANNLYFTPITRENFMQKYLPIQRYIDPDLVLMAEDKEGNLVSTIFAIQDFLNLDEKSLVVKTLARKHGKQWRGLGTVLLDLVVQKARQKDFGSIIHAYMIKNSPSNKISGEFMGDPFKHYALYGWAVKKAHRAASHHRHRAPIS